ncbi:hypothetical protein LshimejAT787_0706030 [Lyophyllum shimeji]|uniref:Uncharacterized protein n=1 Tax=Lyophyllum shimeji TaxID=47721 RepID=A0A9P3PQB5_LYOSH|nr:hypothetical protein LshimejAT787_0706030 [Lyophyllum shimeji]
MPHLRYHPIVNIPHPTYFTHLVFNALANAHSAPSNKPTDRLAPDPIANIPHPPTHLTPPALSRQYTVITPNVGSPTRLPARSIIRYPILLSIVNCFQPLFTAIHLTYLFDYY